MQMFGIIIENAYIKSMKIVAIILAAGKGTRLKSKIAKPLHNIGGRPMLAWSLDAAIAAKASRTITVLPPQSKQIQDWLVVFVVNVTEVVKTFFQ